MTPENRIWNKVTKSLESKLSKEEFNTWFSQASLDKFENNLVIVNVPNKFVANWLKDNYLDELINIFNQILKNITEISFNYSNKYNTDISFKAKKYIPKEPSIKNRLSTSMTFDNFVYGECNKFAYSSALEVAKRPGKNYNPLYIYSELSHGKTHLLNAIGNHISANLKSLNIGILSAESFFQDLNYSFINKDLYTFKDKYLNFDILLLDDIQLIANKTRAQEEFLSIFNTLHDEKKQIVISSDRPPGRIKNINPQLESCLGWGLIVEIDEMDHQLKVQIIKKRIRSGNITLPDDIISFLAKISTNIKILIKNLIRIETYLSLNNKSINISTIRNLIKERYTKNIEIQDIQAVTSGYFNITIADIISDKKKRSFSYPRHLAMYLTKKHTDLSYQEIGYLFGDKDHSTVVYATKKIEKSLSEKNIAVDLNNIENLLT